MSVKVPSVRETEVVRLVAWGYTNKAIAARLGISVKTAESHKSNAMRKLALRDRVDVVKYALGHGWLASHAMPVDEQRMEQSCGNSSSESQ